MIFSSQESDGLTRKSRKRSKSPKKGVLKKGTSKTRSSKNKNRFSQSNPKTKSRPLTKRLSKKKPSKTSHKYKDPIALYKKTKNRKTKRGNQPSQDMDIETYTVKTNKGPK